MSDIEDDVLATFFERLSEADEVKDGVVSGLRQAFAVGKLPKPEQLVQLISDATGEALT